LPIEKTNVRRFLDFLDEDRILHIFTIYDLRFMRNKTKVWAALENDEMRGYLFEFDKRIIHTRGQTEGITELLDYISLEEPVMVIEPHHLAVIEKSFKPVEPTDASSKGKITTYLVMKTNAETFQPSIKHRFKKLEAEDLDEVSERIGEGWAKRVEDAIRRGMAFGAYERDSLASLATVPEIIEDIAFVRGVYTVPSLRSKGLATSATSALIEELISLDKEAILWVAKANTPARKVYEKIGFRKTGQVLLGFKARRL
jgi:GNAT superfamily N-acetyltransferase